MHGRSTTYQRFVGTLEHITDVLAQSRLWRLPTDEAKVINMLYSLDKGERIQYKLMGMFPDRDPHLFYTFLTAQIPPSRQSDRRHNVLASSQLTSVDAADKGRHPLRPFGLLLKIKNKTNKKT